MTSTPSVPTAPLEPVLLPPVAADGSPIRMRLLDPQRDIPAMCTLFTEVFGQPMTEARWRWKYMQAPGSSHYHAVAEHVQTGRLVGHMGVIMLPGVRAGQPVRMAHATDLMISPLARAGLGPDGAYRHIMHTIRSAVFDPAISPPGAAPLFMYGFPGKRPATLAMRLGIQRKLQICQQYATPVAAPGNALSQWWTAHNPWRLQALAQAPEVQAWSDSVLNPVWERFAQELLQQSHTTPAAVRPSTIKNAAYLRWRYLQHPQQQAALVAGEAPPYTLWLLQRKAGSTVVGWLVTRHVGPATIVDSCIPGGPAQVGAALGAMPAPAQGGAWISWLPHPGGQAQDTLIWATAMCGAQFYDSWPGPQFQPGDTDVF